MGYQPVIDCAHEWTGSSWSSQREVLAIGAGAELQLRVRCMGEDVRKQYENEPRKSKADLYNSFGHRESWTTWKCPTLWDGRDDITAINILQHSHDEEEDAMKHSLIVGRASGTLEKVTISRTCAEISSYETRNRPVRSAHVSPSEDPLLAACLSDSAVAIYKVASGSDVAQPLAETSIIQPSGQSIRTWTNRFLSKDRLAVGQGPSKQPLSVYEITPTGISKPFHIYDTTNWGPHRPVGALPLNNTSVYSIMPLASSSTAGSAAGGLFLSGWYTGVTKLHDLRSNCDTVSYFVDPIEPESAVYSLLPFGAERFVAGVARHSQVKVFDLRMPGQRRYHHVYLNAPKLSTTKERDLPSPIDQSGNDLEYPPNFNMYLTIKNRTDHNNRRYASSTSPVYALAAPHSFSPVFYAGLENSIVEVDLVSSMDQYPDSMFTPAKPIQNPLDGRKVQEWLDPEKKDTRPALVEQDDRNFQLRFQGEMSTLTQAQGSVHGSSRWDYRWMVRDAAADRQISARHPRYRSRGTRGRGSHHRGGH